MTLADEIIDDLDDATDDDPTTVDFVSVKTAGNVTDLGKVALKRVVNHDDLVKNPILTERPGTVFNLKASDLSNEPKSNDKIVEKMTAPTPDVEWIVQSATTVTLGTRYRCVCTKAR